MTPALHLQSLHHRYGPTEVLRGLDWTVDGPGVIGFLGLNGAGKTTTLQALMGLLDLTSGQIEILGRAPRDPALRSLVGYLPQAPRYSPWMTGAELLGLCGDLLGLPRAEARARATELLGRLGLTDAAHQRVRTYSGGMVQRLGLCLALLGRPPLLLLDEPVSALDPAGRKELLDLLAELGRDHTVIFSTHILADVERVCDRVAILHRGRIVAEDAPSALLPPPRPELEIELEGDATAFLAALRAAPWVAELAQVGPRWRISARDLAEARRAIPALVAAHGLGLIACQPAAEDLERAFLRIVGEVP